MSKLPIHLCMGILTGRGIKRERVDDAVPVQSRTNKYSRAGLLFFGIDDCEESFFSERRYYNTRGLAWKECVKVCKC